jgi:predicted anti-sigma-YlaC factor YlaD
MTQHPKEDVLTADVVGRPELAPDVVWAVEAHLETCGACRQELTDIAALRTPEVPALVDQVWSTVDQLAVERPAPADRWLVRVARQWAPPAQRPWLVMSALVAIAAFVIDLLSRSPHTVSLVALLAPVTPLFGVAAAWSRTLDPMGELVASSPRAGLELVLRRTVSVLVVMIPLIAVTGGVDGVSVALCLVPCLAFTVGALALGTVLGVRRAAALLGVAWVGVSVVPALVQSHLPIQLSLASLPWWGVAVVLAGGIVLLRGRRFALA